MIDLKPCPFCGSEAKLYVDESGVCVKCTAVLGGCGCRTGRYVDNLTTLDGWRNKDETAVEKAIHAWNRRVSDETD